MELTCALCGKRIRTSGSNFKLFDGQYIHKKCPATKQTMSKEDKKDWDELRDVINNAYVNKPCGFYAEEPKKSLNWTATTTKIKALHNDGYSYKDIKYACEVIFDEMGGFWGIGAVVNRIESVIAKKRALDKKLESSVTYTNNTSEVDLSKMLEKDEDW